MQNLATEVLRRNPRSKTFSLGRKTRTTVCGAACWLILALAPGHGWGEVGEEPGGLAPDFPPLAEEEIAGARNLELISLPTPGELFSAMAKGGRLNWSNAGRAVLPVGAAERPQIALNLGVLLADGYLAIQNQNGQMVKNVGRDLLDMARKLNVGEHVVARGRSITDFAENNDWNSLREELEATQNEIKISLAEQKDDKLVLLVALGAWLRSIQAGSALIAGNFDPDQARLLGQTGLAGEFSEALTRLPERLRQKAIIASMEEGTQALARQMTRLMEDPGTEVVEELGQTSSAMIARITGPTPGGESTPVTDSTSAEGGEAPPRPSGTASQWDRPESTLTPETNRELAATVVLNLNNGGETQGTDPFPPTVQRTLELSGALLNEGFRTRDSIVTGRTHGEKPATLAVWLFARNEYWFAAASEPDTPLALRIFSRDGTPLVEAPRRDDGRAVLGFVPLHTGWFFLQISPQSAQPVPFSLVYSYK